MYATTVLFTIAPGRMAEFLPLVRANAATSRNGEPGCRRFDVCTDPARPDEVFLYEIYDDRAAFDAHLATDHFVAFEAATAAMVAGKIVRTYAEVTG